MAPQPSANTTAKGGGSDSGNIEIQSTQSMDGSRTRTMDSSGSPLLKMGQTSQPEQASQILNPPSPKNGTELNTSSFPPNSPSAYGRPGSTVGGYNSSMVNPYGGMSSGMYSSSMYGGAGYGGYGSGYSGYGSYGSYGGRYGGYGGGYGYGSMGMGMGMMGGPMDGSLGALHGLHQTIASLSQVVELLGMNGQAIGYLAQSFMGILEAVGLFFVHLEPWREFPRGHPRHGEPPPTEEMERRRLNKVRLCRTIIFALMLYGGYKAMRKISQWLQFGRQMKNTLSSTAHSALEDVFRSGSPNATVQGFQNTSFFNRNKPPISAKPSNTLDTSWSLGSDQDNASFPEF